MLSNVLYGDSDVWNQLAYRFGVIVVNQSGFAQVPFSLGIFFGQYVTGIRFCALDPA